MKKKLLFTIITGATIYAALTYGSIVPALTAWDDNYQRAEKQELVNAVPENAPTAATFELLSPLSSRNDIYSLHYALIGKNQFALTDYALPENTEYLAIDWNDVHKALIHFDEHHAFGPYTDSISDNLRRALQTSVLMSARGSIMLFKKNTDKNAITDLVTLKQGETHLSGSDPTIDRITPDKKVLNLALLLPSEPDEDRHYFISVQTEKGIFHLPLGYGLTPSSRWNGNSELTMRIYLPPGESASATIDLHAWTEGFLKLGSLKNLEAKVETELLQSVTVLIDKS